MSIQPLGRCPGLLACTLVLTLGLAACGEGPAPAVEPPAPSIQGGQLRFVAGHPQLAQLRSAATVRAGSVTVELPAKLVWNEERTQRVVPSFAGRVTGIDADVGTQVKAGAVLARLASPDFGAAQADAAKAEADADLSRKALARQRELYEAGIVARKDVEQAEADMRRSAAERARAHARAALYGAAASVDQQLALRAALPGLVVERNLNPGQELRPDPYGPGVPPLFVITDPATLWVQIDAREGDVDALPTGARLELLVPALPGRRFEARVLTTAASIDPGTRTVKVRASVPNPDRLLRAEMLASARLERALGPGVLVPASALVLRGARHFVFVNPAAGVFEPRAVSVGWQGSNQVLITSRLEPGERVVSDNVLLLARQFGLANDQARPGAAAAPSPQAASTK